METSYRSNYWHGTSEPTDPPTPKHTHTHTHKTSLSSLTIRAAPQFLINVPENVMQAVEVICIRNINDTEFYIQSATHI